MSTLGGIADEMFCRLKHSRTYSRGPPRSAGRWDIGQRAAHTSLGASALGSVDMSEALSLQNIRSSLIRQEDTIIFGFIERAQFARNSPVYTSDAIAVPGGKEDCGQPVTLSDVTPSIHAVPHHHGGIHEAPCRPLRPSRLRYALPLLRRRNSCCGCRHAPAAPPLPSSASRMAWEHGIHPAHTHPPSTPIHPAHTLLVPPGFDRSGRRYSLLEYALRETEQLHGKLRRYTSPGEHAFYPGVGKGGEEIAGKGQGFPSTYPLYPGVSGRRGKRGRGKGKRGRITQPPLTRPGPALP